MSVVLGIRGVSVMLGGESIVHGIDLSIEEGEFVGIVGPNGAGKTTLLRAVTGAVPYSGEVEIGGAQSSLLRRAARARAVAMVPQRPLVPPGMVVFDYVLLGRTPHLRLLASESRRDIEAVLGALRSLDVESLAGREMTSLSGGEIQRVVLARAIAQGSPLLLLDEPTSALDVGHSQRVLGLVDAMRRSCGLTVLAAIHDLTLAAQFCDRLVLMAGGAVVSQGRPVSVLTESSIRTHYGATVRIFDEGDGRVVVIPRRETGRVDTGPPPAMEQR